MWKRLFLARQPLTVKDCGFTPEPDKTDVKVIICSLVRQQEKGVFGGKREREKRAVPVAGWKCFN